MFRPANAMEPGRTKLYLVLERQVIVLVLAVSLFGFIGLARCYRKVTGKPLVGAR